MHKEGGTQILRPRSNVLYTILHATSFLLRDRCDVSTQKSRSNFWN